MAARFPFRSFTGRAQDNTEGIFKSKRPREISLKDFLKLFVELRGGVPNFSSIVSQIVHTLFYLVHHPFRRLRSNALRAA
jgi:hypothetical protein